VNEVNSTFSKRLKEVRLLSELSQEALGIKAGLDESVASTRLNQYERGKHLPNLEMVERLADVLNVPAPFFYARDDDLARMIMAYGRMNESERSEVFKKLNVSS